MFPSHATTSDPKAADSLRRISIKDSLVRMAEENKAHYSHPRIDDRPDRAFSIPTPLLFNADITAPSEALSSAPLCVPVSFGLSNRLNRFLVYGNTAPISPVFSDGNLLFTSFDPTKGTDEVFTTEISAINLLPANRCRYTTTSSGVVVPEGSFFWENGVFKENVLALRFTRPFSERLTVNVFSNYRHFDAMPFDHADNDVYNLYKSLTPDSSTIVNNGYNPLTNEYAGGARLQWTGARGNEVHLGAKYTDCVNDLALDRPASNSGQLVWSRLNQYRTVFDLGSAGNRLGLLGLDCQGRFESDAMVRYTPESGGTARRDGSNKELSFAIRAEVPLGDPLSAALLYRMKRIDRKPFNLAESNALEQTPELSLTLRRGFGPFRASGTATAGYDLYRLESAFGHTPSWSLSAEAGYGEQQARVYETQAALPYDVPYDNIMGIETLLLDRYRIIGGEVSLRRGAAAIVLGCQSIEGIEFITVRHAWPEAVPPYEQPRLVFLAAPALGPWHGFSLSSRTLLSDSKPVIKSQTILSCTAHPAGTREHIDLRLGFDYWSGRDTIVFANLRDWNRPVYNVSFELAAHIISFRFFGKIDNLLNRKYAYVPGYYSPGVTFRWGFNWFLQR